MQRLLRAGFAACLAFTLPVAAETYRGRIGVEIEGGAEGARSRMFVDLGKVFRPFTRIGGGEPTPVDENGWPLSDAQAVFFDIRPVPEWLVWLTIPKGSSRTGAARITLR
jgi:hypothetical protein